MELNQSPSPASSGRSAVAKVVQVGCDGEAMSSESGPSPRSPSAATTPMRAATGPLGGGVMPWTRNSWAPPATDGVVSCQPCHTARLRGGSWGAATTTVSDQDPKQPPNPVHDTTSATA